MALKKILLQFVLNHNLTGLLLITKKVNDLFISSQLTKLNTGFMYSLVEYFIVILKFTT